MAEVSVRDALDLLLSEEDPFTKLVFDKLDEILSEEQKVSFESRGLFDFMRVFCTALREFGHIEKHLCPEHSRQLLRFAWDLWCTDKVRAPSVIKVPLEKDIAQDA